MEVKIDPINASLSFIQLDRCLVGSVTAKT